MQITLSDNIQSTIKEKRRTLRSLEQEIIKLEKSLAYANRLDVFWSERITIKNLGKTLSSARILSEFAGRIKHGNRKTKREERTVTNLPLSTKQLWHLCTDLPSIRKAKPDAIFRRHLDSMQTKGLLEYSHDTRKWTLTQKGAELIK